MKSALCRAFVILHFLLACIEHASGICVNQAPGSFVAHSSDCRLFYLCLEQNNDAILAFCPAGMLFNPLSQLCDAAANVNCVSNAVGGSSVSTPTTTVSNATPNNELEAAKNFCSALHTLRIAYIGSASNCSVYYMCYYGQAVQQHCSMNLQWNAASEQCDTPARANCALNNNISNNNNYNNNINNNNNLAISQESNLILCPSYGQHIYPHMERCDFFIYCVKGQATLQRCPFYRNFDVASSSCQWRSRALCVRDL